MKLIKGIWFPDGDQHFEAQLAANPLIEGRGTYQWKKYIAARDLVGVKRHAVDVGGHVGLWSRVMARDFDRVTAFEPLPSLRECFERNAPDVTLMPYAVGARDCDARIEMPADNTGNAQVSERGELVRMVALDGQDLDPIDLLKIDVEGYEFDVVRGAEHSIKRNRPVIVIEQKRNNAERYGWKQWDAVGLLKDWGMIEVAMMNGDHILRW